MTPTALPTVNCYQFEVCNPVIGSWKSTCGDDQSQYLFACGTGLVHRSSDGGSSWSAIQPAGSSTSNYPWNAVGCDSSGQYVFACANGYGVWTSSDYGVSWTQSHSLPGGTLNQVKCNPSGQYVAVVTSGSK